MLCLWRWRQRCPIDLFLCCLRTRLVGVCVWVISQLDRGLLRIHGLAPRLLAHCCPCILHGLCDSLPGSGEINTEEMMVVLDDVAIDHHCMHVSAPRLKH